MKHSKGDTKRQASIRDRLIKKSKEEYGDKYITKILTILNPESKLIDIGCGTAHIIRKIAEIVQNVFLIGHDISPAMLKLAKKNTKGFTNIGLVQGDGLKLPLQGAVVDIVINRLADYSPPDVYRVLKKGGYFFEYGLGPDADKEIREFFPDRYEEENFFLPEDPDNWKKEVRNNIKEFGFCHIRIEDYKIRDYYKDKEEIMDLIEMVPLLKRFDREKDSKKIDEFVERYKEKRGIGITWHYYILEARKPKR